MIDGGGFKSFSQQVDQVNCSAIEVFRIHRD